MTDLIAIEATGQFNVVNAIGVNGKIRFEEKLLTRGFTGALQNGEPLAEDEFCRGGLSQEVVVFPKYGIRYHEPDCYYVTQQEKDNPCKLEMEREDASRKGYTPCKVCHGAANVR